MKSSKYRINRRRHEKKPLLFSSRTVNRKVNRHGLTRRPKRMLHRRYLNLNPKKLRNSSSPFLKRITIPDRLTNHPAK